MSQIKVLYVRIQNARSVSIYLRKAEAGKDIASGERKDGKKDGK